MESLIVINADRLVFEPDQNGKQMVSLENITKSFATEEEINYILQKNAIRCINCAKHNSETSICSEWKAYTSAAGYCYKGVIK